MLRLKACDTHTDTHSVSDFTRFFCTCKFTEIFFQDPTGLHMDQYSTDHKKEESYTSRGECGQNTEEMRTEHPRLRSKEQLSPLNPILKKQLPLETLEELGCSRFLAELCQP